MGFVDPKTGFAKLSFLHAGQGVIPALGIRHLKKCKVMLCINPMHTMHIIINNTYNLHIYINAYMQSSREEVENNQERIARQFKFKLWGS